MTWIVFALFVALCAGLLAHFSITVHPRFITMKDAVDSQQAILDRRVFVFDGMNYEYPSWRNRVMLPLAIQTLSRGLGISFSQGYVVLRWVTACAGLLAFGCLVRRGLGFGRWGAAAAIAMFTLSLFPTFLHIYEIPSDFLDAAFFSLLLVCVLERRRLAFVALLIVAVFNRESAIFATVAWLALHAPAGDRRSAWRESAFSIGLGAAAAALVFWLRVKNAVTATPGVETALQPFDPWSLFAVHWRMIVDFWRYPLYGSPLFFLFGYLGLLLGVVLLHGRSLTAPQRRLGWAALAIYTVSLVYGNIDELRIYIPSLVIATYLLCAIARDQLPAPASPPSVA